MSQLNMREEFKALRKAVHAHYAELLKRCNEDHYTYGHMTIHLWRPGVSFPLFIDGDKDRTDREVDVAWAAFNRGAEDARKAQHDGAA